MALLQDIRFAVRVLLKSRTFSIIAILTLALGIGANTALFSVVNGVLLNPLAYPHSSQLVAINEKNAGMAQAPISYLNFLDWEGQTQTLSSMAMYRHEDYNFTGKGPAERVTGSMVTAGFFSTLGVAPMLGRDFRREEDVIGGAPVVVLGGGFWKRRFGASPDAIGKAIELRFGFFVLRQQP
jgi:hypothetical protein